MSISRVVLGILRENPNAVWTPKSLQYEALRRNIPLSYENAKKILQRYGSRISRGQYIFSLIGDKRNHSKGQKGTLSRGRNHSIESEDLTNSPSKKGHKKGFFSEKSFPIRRQVFFIFWNNKKPLTIKDVCFLVKDYRGYVNYRTVQSAINYFNRMGILGKKKRGVYFIKNLDLARFYFDYEIKGTPLGDRNQRDEDGLITVSHHFRIKKPIPLKEDELGIISKYLWSKEPIKDYVNGIYLEAYPTSDRDRSHGLKVETAGATFHITYSYKKGMAKVMIYPKRKEMWEFYAEKLFGKEFVDRAIRIGISSHFGFNLDEISKVLWEGEEIKVTINKSDFGTSGDLEFEGVSEEGGELAKKLIESKLKAVGEVVDVFENVREMLIEMEGRLHLIERNVGNEELERRIESLEKDVAEIKDHVVLHTRFINLVLKDYPNFGGEVEGYA